MSGRDVLLTIRSLGCVREGRRLFENLDLTVSAGECVELTGPNGSGKSTLLRAITGLFPDVEGDIDHLGLEYLGHKAGVSALLSPLANLRWYQGLEGDVDSDDALLMRLLAQAGLAGFEDIPCQQLSAGQQRRVALARLGLSRHPLWLLDEPFTALDGEGQTLVRDLINQHIRSGGAALCATHQPLAIDGALTLALERFG